MIGEKDNFEEWIKEYNPILNHIDTNASFNGFAFETYGKELDFIKLIKNNHIWTLITSDNDDMYIISGYHLVNRLCYFVTEKQWNEDLEIDISEYYSKDEAQLIINKVFKELFNVNIDNNLLTFENNKYTKENLKDFIIKQYVNIFNKDMCDDTYEELTDYLYLII